MRSASIAIIVFASLVLITGIILKATHFPGWFMPVGLGVLGLILGGILLGMGGKQEKR
ncbi:MAG: hypothetical protein AAFY71_07250 [Bacteroidota bacterium]